MRERLSHKFLVIQVVLLIIMFLLAIGLSLLVYLLVDKYNINSNLPQMNSEKVNKEEPERK